MGRLAGNPGQQRGGWKKEQKQCVFGRQKSERTKQKQHCAVVEEEEGEGTNKPHGEVIYSLPREKEKLLSLK